MKKLILFLVLFPTVVQAQVYIACDYDPAAVEYVLEFDGVEQGPFKPVDYQDNLTLVYDIEPLITLGSQHVIRLKGVNAWGDEGDWSVPFDFILTGSPGAYTTILREIPQVPALLILVIP